MRTIIIEDEKAPLMHLVKLLKNHASEIDIVGNADSVETGQELISSTNPELVFMDIRLSRKTAFDLLSALDHYSFDVIFVSGYDEYGVTAIRFSALDYILKPVNASDLARAVARAKTRKDQQILASQIGNLLSIMNEKSKTNHRIALPLMKEIRYVFPAEVIRCEAQNNYTLFVLKSGEKVLVSQGFYEYEQSLLEYGLFRCHQSHIINLQFVKSMLKKDYTSEVLLANLEKIPVSRLKLAELKQLLK